MLKVDGTSMFLCVSAFDKRRLWMWVWVRESGCVDVVCVGVGVVGENIDTK